jgi:hypothetical protein
MVGNEVHRGSNKVKWGISRIFGKLALPECFDSISEPGLPLEGTVDNGALANSQVTEFPTEGDVQQHV